MKLTILNKVNSKNSKSIELKEGLITVGMTREEAIRTIKSLAAQLASGECNAERYEKYCEDGTDFTIYVDVTK